MPIRAFLSRRRRTAAAGFSLVEVALSLGVVGFVLVGLIGAIPVASNAGRQSIEQSRAASIAGTVFANLRAGRFSQATLNDGTDTIDLNTNKTENYYAYFDETPATGTDVRLHFVSGKASTPTTASSPNYSVTLRLNNNPPGTLAPGTATHAQANAVEVSVYALARPRDVYRFSSVVANRLD